MYLRDIQLVPNWSGDVRQNNLALRDAVGHVELIFESHLPKKFKLNEYGKIVIRVGEHDPRHHREFLFSEGMIFTTSHRGYSRREFDRSSPVQREESALEIIVTVLTRLRADAGAVDGAAAATREGGFQREIILRASKWHRSRRYRAAVVVTYRRGGVDLSMRLVDRDGLSVFELPVLTGSHSHEVYHASRKGRWVESTFELLNTAGEVQATLKLPIGASGEV